jgi:hypothetical protein
VKKFDCLLVTGASSGLGEEFARQLAHRCRTMVLVARRGDLLSVLAAELIRRHGVEVHCFQADLADVGQRLQLAAALEEKSLVPDCLINNAGVGDYGTFADAEWTRVENMLRLNMEGLTHLIHLFLPKMIARSSGVVVNVSSIASLVPMPDLAIYAATKAYVSSFSEALRIELREHNISVFSVCPGPVHTGFGKAAARTEGEQIKGVREWFCIPKEQCVAESIRAMDLDRARIFPGLKVALVAAGISLVPLALIRLIMANRPRRV